MQEIEKNFDEMKAVRQRQQFLRNARTLDAKFFLLKSRDGPAGWRDVLSVAPLLLRYITCTSPVPV
jgi:hypothetical protein